jgi:hypothetical protein
MIYFSFFQKKLIKSIVNKNTKKFLEDFDKKIEFLPKIIQEFIYLISFRSSGHIFNNFGHPWISGSYKDDSIYIIDIVQKDEETYTTLLNKIFLDSNSINDIISFNYINQNYHYDEIFLNRIFGNPSLTKLYITSIQEKNNPEHAKMQKITLANYSKKLNTKIKLEDF